MEESVLGNRTGRFHSMCFKMSLLEGRQLCGVERGGCLWSYTVSSIVPICFSVMFSLMMVVKVCQVLPVTQALETLAILRQTWISYKRKQKRKTNPKNMDEL